jgi:hypothetical protein
MTVATITTSIIPAIGSDVWVITADHGIVTGKMVEVITQTYLNSARKVVGVNVTALGGIQHYSPSDVYDNLHEAIVEYETRLS